MEKMILKEFKDRSNIEIIQEYMKMNNGYITSKQVSDIGIHRMYLKIMNDNGLIERIGKGIYIDPKKTEDMYFVFSKELPNVIYSHMTALYFHNISIKAPNGIYDISVPSKYNNSKIKKHNVYYVNKKIYNLGITEVETSQGNKVKAYDIERCICDIIRSKNRMDLEHVKYSVKEYLKRKDKNLVKLSEYAHIMGIKKEVMDFLGMMYE